MRPHWILYAVAAVIGFHNITGLKLVDNGYEDLYVVIGETVPESDELLHRIKEIFTNASKLLYISTHRRAYFKSVKIVIPKTWSSTGSYCTVSALVSSTIHIKVGNQASIVPVTVGNEKCGKEGMYTYLHYQAFVLQEDTTLWGKHASVIVHEWGHLRWGLKDEYPTISKQKVGYVNQIDVGNPMTLRKVEDKISFYQDGGMWKPVSCSSDMTGYTSTSCKTGQPVGDCEQGDTSRMIAVNCKFCPDMVQRRNASIMGFQYIPSVTEFCDKDDPNTPVYRRHNNKAINEQNKFCDGKSAWEIMREHDDFKDDNNPPSDDEDPPETEFQICQESSGRVRVLVLDTSGSMDGEKIENLYDASKYLIETVLPLGSWLGIIGFNYDAVVLSDMSQINSNVMRQTLVSSLPDEGSGATCIACGINLGLEMKNQRLTTTQNVPASITFSVDEGLGTGTTVTVVSKEVNDIDIVLTGPNDYTQRLSNSHARTLSLVVPGISEQGQYTATVTCALLSCNVIITSKPTSTSADVIRPIVKISTNTMDFTNIKTLPVIYVYLRKGESPVKKAEVQAIVEDPFGNDICVLNLSDNGADPDIKSGDGIYSAVILRECQQGNGRHSTRVIITGTHDTVVTHYTNSGSATIDTEANVAEDTPTGSFERVAVADAYTVNNYTDSVASTDETPPGRITDVQVIDIHSGNDTTSLTRTYAITWTATGDDYSSGQASWYEMRISDDQSSLQQNFTSTELLNVSGVGMTPNVSGKVERLHMIVSSNDAFTYTTYFAIVAVDEVGNRGEVSNIIPITIGLASQFEVIEEECTDNCYAIFEDCGGNINVTNGQVNFTGKATSFGQTVPILCDAGFHLNGAGNVTCMAGGIWSTVATCDAIDNASKLNLWIIVAIVATCIGLAFLVGVALVMRKFMKTKTRRGSRKIHVRKMPQDYNTDYSLEDGMNSATDTPVMVTYGDKGLEKPYPNWLLPVMFTYGNSGLKTPHPNLHLQDRPTQPSHNDMQYRYEMEVSC